MGGMNAAVIHADVAAEVDRAEVGYGAIDFLPLSRPFSDPPAQIETRLGLA